MNGAAADLAVVSIRVLPGASPAGVMLDPATGNVFVGAAVPAGTYRLVYEVCERSNPENCAQGQITISISPALSTLAGTVYDDRNGDQKLDLGESRRAGWIVEVIRDGAVVAAAVSDSEGNYRIADLLSGTAYSIRFTNPDNQVVYQVIGGVTLTSNTVLVDQNLPLDPSGLVYDSITREPIRIAVVTMVGAGGALLPVACFLAPSQQNQATDSGGNYRFDVVPGASPLSAGTSLKAELAQTDGPAFGQANSVDGGLSFTALGATGVAGRAAQAWKIEGGIDFAELAGKTGDHGKIAAFYENFEAGFAASSHLTQSDTTRWGVSIAVPLGTGTRFDASYAELQSASAGMQSVTSIDLAQKFGGGFDIKIGLRRDQQAAGLLYNSIEVGTRTDAALQAGYTPTNRNWSVYGFGQVTLESAANRSGNDRAGAGAKLEISDKSTLSGEVSGGDGGIGADVQLSHRYGQGSEAYIGYSLLADRTDTGLEPANLFTRSNRGNLTVGARHRFGPALSIFGENRIGLGGSAPSMMRTFGAKFDPSAALSFSASFERGQIDDASTGLFKRTAATFGFGYTNKDVQFGSNVEARFERGVGRDQAVWLVRNTAAVQLGQDWRALGRLNFAIAKTSGASLRAADYVEGVVGFAYRPVLHDRLNVLARVNYFQDLGPVGQITAGESTTSPKQRSRIGVIDVNFDLSNTLTIGAKFGYRAGLVSLNRTSDTFVASNTHLGILRLDWRPAKRWDGVIEAHFRLLVVSCLPV